MAKRTRTSVAVELGLWVTVAFVGVLVYAWVKMPDLQRGVKTVVDDIAAELGFQEEPV